MIKVSKYKYFFAVSDFFILSISAFISVMILRSELYANYLNLFSRSVFSFLILVPLIFALLFIFEINNLYKVNIIITRSTHLTALIKSLWYFILLALVVVLIIAGSTFYHFGFIIFNFTVCSVFLLYLFRVEIFRRVYLKLKNKRFRRNILIVGNGRSGKMLATKLFLENPAGINIVGFVEDSKKIGEEIISGKKILGHYSDLKQISQKEKIEEILIVQETQDYEKLLTLIDLCQESNSNVKITSDLFNIIPQKTFTEKYANIPVINLSSNYKSEIYLKFKRIFDMIGAAFGLFLLSPFLLLISLLIRFTSAGPVLFKQIRIGKDGKPFIFYKYRTMFLAKEEDEDRKEKMLSFMKGTEELGCNKKVINNSRVTKVGKILRKMSLDELPQLFNVILGDMSLVGPRPCIPYEYERYDNWQKRRFNVLPGCTGVWQVMGRSSVSFNDSIILDLFYINNMSPWLDLQLIIKTIPVMLFERGGE